MTKILFISLEQSQNKGDAARLIGLLILLQKSVPDAELIKLSFYPEIDYETFKDYNIKLVKIKDVKLSKFMRLLRPLRCIVYKYLKLKQLVSNDPLLEQYAQANIIFDLSGDDLREETGFRGFFYQSYAALLGILMGKNMAICSSSIGPFKTRRGKLLAKFILNRMKVISVRESLSKEYLEKLGIKKQIYLVPDMGLLMPPAPLEAVRKILLNEGIDIDNRPLIGISVNETMMRILRLHKLEHKYNEFIILMARIVDYVIEKFNSYVVFIPHCVAPYGDDRVCAKNIYKIIKNKDRVKLINTEYSPEELKAIIGQCDIFIGARMHSCIAAASMNVPFIAIVYNERRKDVMKMFGLEEYICNVTIASFDEMKTKIEDILANREKVKEKLKTKVKMLNELALINGKLIKSLAKNQSK